MTRRPWTAAELQVVRSCPPKEAARRLGRPVNQVHWARARHRIVRRFRWLNLRVVRQHHARGRSDGEIAHRMGVWPSVVSVARRRLGLPPNRHTPAAKAWLMRCRRAAARRLGCDRFEDIRSTNARMETVLQGWPAGTSRPAARALAAIEGGADTSRALSLVIRISVVNACRWFRRFHAEGWVVSDGARPRRWSLAPAVAARRAAKREAAA